MRNFIYNLIDDNTTKRKIYILETLNNGKISVSAEYFAKELRCSKRTVINVISQLKKELPENWDVISVKPRGYILIKPMTDSILPIISNYLTESILYKIMLGIFNNQYYTLDKWSRLLFIDKSTLWKRMKNYKSILNENMLSINSRKLQLEGDEVNIRHYYITFFYFSKSFVNKPLLPKNLTEKLFSVLNCNEININWHLFYTIVFVWINRIHKKYYITQDIRIKPIYTDAQLNNVNEIIAVIGDYYGIKIPKKEKEKLSIDLFVCSSSSEIQRELIIEYLKRQHHALYESYLILITFLLNENDLSSDLNRKLEIELIGSFYKIFIYNELKIASSYSHDPLEHAKDVLYNNKEIISLVSNWNKKYNDEKFSVDEIEYFGNYVTIILNSVIKSRNILLVGSGIPFEDYVIYKKLTQNLGRNIKIHTTIDNNIEYDLIISNFEIPDKKIPVISFTGMMTDNEINQIKNYILSLK
ncbi:hypothetical protein COE50_06360 [Bacillus anthracis]|nr:hypothetical protein COE50_06360 [Bacillus anthracis]